MKRKTPKWDSMYEMAQPRERQGYYARILSGRRRSPNRDRQAGDVGKFPWTEFFDSLDQWLEYMRADHEDYTDGDEDQH